MIVGGSVKEHFLYAFCALIGQSGITAIKY